MTTLGRAYIEIVADGSGFPASLRHEVEQPLDDVLTAAGKKTATKTGPEIGHDLGSGISDGLKKSAPEIEKAGEDLGKSAGDSVGKGVKKSKKVIPDVFDDTATLKKAITLGEDVARTLSKAAADESKRTGISVDFGKLEADIARESKTVVERFYRELRTGSNQQDPSFLIASEKLVRAADNAGKRITIATAASILKSSKTVEEAMGKVGEDAGKALESSFGKRLLSLGKGLGTVLLPLTKGLGALAGAGSLAGLSFAAVAGGAALLTPQLLSLGAAAVSLTGIFLALPAALGPLALTFIAAKFAFAGFAKAATAIDDKAFAKATANMGTNAKKLATELRNLMPQFRSVQQAAQDAFASQVLGNVAALTKAITGPLRTGFKTLGTDIGSMTDKFGLFLASSKGVTLLQQWFNTAHLALSGFGNAFTQVLVGFADLNTKAKPIVDGLALGFDNLVRKFGLWVQKISASGKATAWIQTALQVLRELGKIVENVASLLESAFKNSGQTALSFLSTVELITGGIGKFFASAAGGKALRDFFDALAGVSAALMPIFNALGTALAGIVPLIAKAVVALAPGLAALVTALGQALANLGPAIVPLFTALSSVITTIAPQLPLLATAFANLVLAIVPLLPLLAPLIAALAQGLTAALVALTPLVNDFVNAITPLLQYLDAHKQIVIDVAAAFLGAKLALIGFSVVADGVKFAGIVGGFSDILKQSAGIGPALQAMADQFTGAGFKGIGKALDSVGLAMQGTVKSVQAMGVAFATFVTETIPAMVVGLGELTADMIGLDIAMDANPIGVVALGIAALIAIIAGLVVGVIELVKHWGAVMDFFKAVPGVLKSVWDAIVKFVLAIPGALTTAFDAVTGFFTGLWSAIVGFVEAIPGFLGSMFAAVGSALLSALQALPGLAVKGLEDLGNAMLFALGAEIGLIVGVFYLLPRKLGQILADFIPAAAKWVGDLFTEMINLTIQGIVDLIVWFRDLGVRIFAELLRIPQQMHDFWFNLWHDSVDTVRRWLNETVQFLIDLWPRMWAAIKSIPGLLGAFFTGLWKDSKETVKNLINDVITFFASLITGIPGALKGLGNAITSAFIDAGNALFSVLEKIYHGFATVVRKFPGGDVFPADITLGFKYGGIVPGVGNQDSQLAMLTPGEGVLTKQATARIGGAATIQAINSGATIQRFSIGGVVGGFLGGIGSAAKDAWAKALGFGADILKFLTDPSGWLEDVINNSALGKLGNSQFANVVKGIPSHVMGFAIDKLKSVLGPVAGLFGKDGKPLTAPEPDFTLTPMPVAPGNIYDWVRQAVTYTGVPDTWIPRLLVGIGRESGYDPLNVNTTDINAQLGHPSIGLMQLIGPTFEAYRLRSLVDNIYDPVANIAAGIKYILAIYGSIFNVQQFNPNLPPKGYAAGALITQPTVGLFGEAGPELVLPMSRPARVMQLARDSGLTAMLAANVQNGGATNSTVIHAPITVSAPNADPVNVAYKVTAQIARLAQAGY